MFKKYIFIVCFFIVCSTSFCQNEEIANEETFILSGTIFDEELLKPIGKANIEISGGSYTTSSNAGDFRIRARIGDELIIRSDEFETVYFTIEDEQSLRLLVKKSGFVTKNKSGRVVSTGKIQIEFFPKYIDSANLFLKKDAKKSIEYVTKAFESSQSSKLNNRQNAIAYETLGDINSYWQQHDLAIENYKTSLESRFNIDVKIKLATAFKNNKNYQESISLYKDILIDNLSPYQSVIVYEGLGDVFKEINDTANAIKFYQEGLTLANEHIITPKITDLNSKIGEVFANSGNISEAENYFGNSLELAESQNKKRALTEQNKVADFFNTTRNFDKEIELRTKTLSDLESLGFTESEEGFSDDLSPQRQNYKIANAFVAKDQYEDAIPYLEKSIEEADAKEDLVVEKDATRKLSEIYRDIGEFDKASESYQRYVELVDELYIKKEQELSQAKRFNRDIAIKQNRIISLESERNINESRYKLIDQNQQLIVKNDRVQKWVIVSLIALAILLLFIAYILKKNIRQQKYANNQLALKSLRSQMNPHFIFNALNSVNSFIAKSDERTANKYLSDFSQLMRSVLENSEEDFIPLSKEISLLEIYTKLEHFRFKDKFEYEITVDKNLQVDEFLIPPMLLQPYVENAVWHGLRYKKEKGMLQVAFAQKDSETLEITITDNGIGRKKSKEVKTENQKKQQSKGMGNIKKRISILNEMYKDKVDVVIEDVFDNGEGTCVKLIIKKD